MLEKWLENYDKCDATNKIIFKKLSLSAFPSPSISRSYSPSFHFSFFFLGILQLDQ